MFLWKIVAGGIPKKARHEEKKKNGGGYTNLDQGLQKEVCSQEGCKVGKKGVSSQVARKGK